MRAILTALFAIFLCYSETILIDHNATNINAIPQEYLIKAKESLHIAYGHTSHGSQLTTGMTGLVAFANGGGKGLEYETDFFAWNNGGSNGALDLHDYAMDGDVGNYPQWVNNTTSYLGEPNEDGRGSKNPDVNVILWSWCGQVDNKYQAGTIESEYLIPMDSLEELYFGVTFIYMTGHVNYWADSDTKAGNQIIRDFCKTEEKILYDFADIECYDPDGNFYEFVTDGCDYYNANGSYQGNWAVNWQESHTEDIDWYTCTAAHSEPLNANLKAYAAWHLWARLAGWENKTEITSHNNQNSINSHTIKAFPDASKTSLKVYLNTNNTPTTLSLISTKGQILFSTQLSSQQQVYEIPLGGLSEGHYILKHTNGVNTSSQSFVLLK